MAVADRAVIEENLTQGDWNEIAVTATGPRIEIHLNGARTVEYVEPDELVQDGVICLQAHMGGPSLAWYRDIEIRRLQAR